MNTAYVVLGTTAIVIMIWVVCGWVVCAQRCKFPSVAVRHQGIHTQDSVYPVYSEN